MTTRDSKAKRRGTVAVNYLSLVITNVCFYFVWVYADVPHIVDAVGIGALVVVAVTFVLAYWRTGLWQLTHASSDALDERELEITHNAISRSYSWFSVICLVIMMTHAVVYRTIPGLDFALSVPLVGSLIYLAHTLPGAVLAWTETKVPGKAE